MTKFFPASTVCVSVCRCCGQPHLIKGVLCNLSAKCCYSLTGTEHELIVNKCKQSAPSVTNQQHTNTAITMVTAEHRPLVTQNETHIWKYLYLLRPQRGSKGYRNTTKLTHPRTSKNLLRFLDVIEVVTLDFGALLIVHAFKCPNTLGRSKISRNSVLCLYFVFGTPQESLTRCYSLICN